MKRQGVSDKGIRKRLQNLALWRVGDPRTAWKVSYSLQTLLTALVTAMVTKARSLRMVEQRTGQIAAKKGPWMTLDGRIADNTFGKVLPRVQTAELMGCLHRLVKAEHRRGNLKPTRLSRGTVAIDGKNVATVHWQDMLRLLGLAAEETTPEAAATLFAEKYPLAQVCTPAQGLPYALIRVHTATLVSSKAAVPIHQRPIAGCTNEIGSLQALLDELKAAYGRTRLFSLVTTDAGNTSCAVGKKLVAQGLQYFAQIKSIHGDLYAEAVDKLGRRTKSCAQAETTDLQNGRIVSHFAWVYDLSELGWLDWTHARGLVRIQRICENPNTGEVTRGNRYYVTSLSPDALTPRSALETSRAHWRCENNTHWTADAELQEDQRRLAWSRHPNGNLVVSALRMMAIAILAIARALCRFDHTHEMPSWTQLAEHFLLQLCGSILLVKQFDDV